MRLFFKSRRLGLDGQCVRTTVDTGVGACLSSLLRVLFWKVSGVTGLSIRVLVILRTVREMGNVGFSGRIFFPKLNPPLVASCSI